MNLKSTILKKCSKLKNFIRFSIKVFSFVKKYNRTSLSQDVYENNLTISVFLVYMYLFVIFVLILIC